MKLTNSPLFFGLLLVMCVFVSTFSAQDGRPADGPPREGQAQPPNPQDVRGNVLRQLGLTREQAQQMRRINQERKPLMDAAQKRLREANRSLDEAIYADQVNEADFQTRLKEHHLAQAEVARIRFTNELSVRRILTPEQLLRFRDFRKRFEQARQALDRRQGNAERPLDRPARNNNPNRPAANNNAAPFQPKPQPVRQNQRKPDF